MAEEQSKDKSTAEKHKPDVTKLGKALPTKLPRRWTQPEEIQAVIVKKPKINLVFWFGFGVAVIALIAFLNTMINGFVFSDSLNYDLAALVGNYPHYWSKLFVEGVTNPLSQQWLQATYAFDLLGFNWYEGYAHGSSMLFHVLAVVTFFLFVFRLGFLISAEKRLSLNPYYLAAAAGAFLACHPLVSGAVAFVSARGTLLCAISYFLALNFVLSGVCQTNFKGAAAAYVLCILSTFLGIESSDQAVTIPFVCVAVMLLIKPSSVIWREWILDRIYEIGLLVIVGLCAVATFFIRHSAVIDNGFGLAPLPPLLYYCTQLKALVTYYLRCTVAPFGLSIDPPYVLSTGLADPGTLVGACALVAAGYGIYASRKSPMIMFGMIMFVAGLLPWLVKVQPEFVADQRFYLPIAGLSVVFGFLIARLAKQSPKPALAVCTIVLLALTSLSIWRNIGWRSNDVLWWRALKMNPNSARSHGQLALSLMSDHKYDDAAKHAKEALRLDANSLDANLALGAVYLQQLEYAKAKDCWLKALAQEKALKFSDLEMAQLKFRLAIALYRLNQFEDARQYAEDAKDLYDQEPIIHLILGKGLIEQNQPLAAVYELQKGLESGVRDKEFIEPLCQALLATGVPEHAQLAYAMTSNLLKAKSGVSPQVRLLYARALFSMGMHDQAYEQLKFLKKMGPHDAGVVYVLSLEEAQHGNTQEADKLAAQALKLDDTADWRYRTTDVSKKIKHKLPLPVETMPNADEKIQVPEAGTIVGPHGRRMRMPSR